MSRLGRVGRIGQFKIDEAVLVESWSNDTWVTQDAVLRVCWRGDRDRLERERQVLNALPPSLPHASVLDFGEWEDGTWIVLGRIPGERLDLAWPTLPTGEHRRAWRRVGGILRLLHEWTPPQDVASLLRVTEPRPGMTPSEVAGSVIVPWPRCLLSPLLEWSERLLDRHSDVHRALHRRVEELGPAVAVAEFEGSTVVHGDAHAANFLYDAGEVVALLDYEWARTGPPDLELEANCRDDPDIDVGINGRGSLATEVSALAGLRESYPELFGFDHQTERLWLFQLCAEIRSMCVWADIGVSEHRLARLRSIAAHPWFRF